MLNHCLDEIKHHNSTAIVSQKSSIFSSSCYHRNPIQLTFNDSEKLLSRIFIYILRNGLSCITSIWSCKNYWMKLSKPLINISDYWVCKILTDKGQRYVPPVALAILRRSTFLHLLTAMAPASTKYFRQRSSIPPVVSITLAPVERIFWMRSFVISDSLHTVKFQLSCSELTSCKIMCSTHSNTMGTTENLKKLRKAMPSAD
jgi:hypothetical protein